MRFRFLYLDEAGEEVEVGGLEDLQAAVADGRVDEETLLYDAETREWAPARAHSAFRLITAEDGEGEDDQDDESPESGIPGMARADSMDDMPRLTPLPAPDIPDAGDDFIKRQKRERELQGEQPAGSQLRMMDPSGDLADRTKDVSRPERRADGERAEGGAGRPPEASGPATRRPDEAPPRFPHPALARGDDGDEVVGPVPRIRSKGPPPKPITRSPVGDRRRSIAMVGGVLVVLVGAWALLDGDGGAEAGDLPAAALETEPAPEPPAGALPDRVAAATGSAFEDMVVSMDSLRAVHDLTDGPQNWLDGHYLATASEYPGVQAYWERYLEFVTDLRAQDTALFRAGFVKRLRGDGIEGPVISMRLARAMDDFGRSQPARDTLYAGMEELARSALELHAFLLRYEDEVEYDPVRPGALSRDPVMEAFPSDPVLRDRLWSLLDRTFEALDFVQGGVPGSRDQMVDATLREILEAGGRN